MEKVKEFLVEGFKKEIALIKDYSAIKQLRSTLSTTNFRLNCFDPTKDIYVLSYKSLITRLDYKDISEVLNEIDNKFDLFKTEIISDMQKNDYNELVDLSNSK
jgi:hypothetical protein